MDLIPTGQIRGAGKRERRSDDKCGPSGALLSSRCQRDGPLSGRLALRVFRGSLSVRGGRCREMKDPASAIAPSPMSTAGLRVFSVVLGAVVFDSEKTTTSPGVMLVMCAPSR